MVVYIIKSLGNLLLGVTNQEKKLPQLLVEICCFFFFLMKYFVFSSKNKIKIKKEEREKGKIIPKSETKNIRALKSVRVFFQEKKNFSSCKNICLL